MAGLFYPAEPDELRATVESYLAAAQFPGGSPKALIAPHAGYVYSGPVAAAAYASLVEARGTVRRVRCRYTRFRNADRDRPTTARLPL